MWPAEQKLYSLSLQPHDTNDGILYRGITEMVKFFSLYPHQFAPPEWVLEYETTDTDAFAESLNSIRVYYNSKDDLTDVMKCMKERDPVNIKMNEEMNAHDLELMKMSLFGRVQVHTVRISNFLRKNTVLLDLILRYILMLM